MSETGPGWFNRKRADNNAKNNKSPSAKTNTRPRRTGIMVLEPRMMYDAAAAATVAATETHQDAAADHAVVAAAADKQTVAVTSNTGAETQSAAASTTPAQAPNVAAPAAPASASGTDAGKATTSADTSAAAAAPAIVTVHELVVIDSRVDDIDTLLGGVKAGDAVLVLDPSKDGVQQIADAIAANNLHELTAIQIISHGTPGAVDLGSISLSDDNLDSHAAALAAMGAALAPGGDIMLWGCDVAAGATGAKFIADLSAHTGGAHVAASTDATGSAALGGNWTLEAKTGDIDATLPFSDATRDAYTDLLAAPINNYQSSVALTQLVVPTGAYPSRDPGGGGGFVIGTIRTFAGNFAIGNTYYAEGQLEAINQNIALFSLLGTFYGGDGKSTYALPDLGGKVMIGQGVGSDGHSHDVGEQEGSATVSLTTLNLPGTGNQPFSTDQPSLTITYGILTQGVFPTNNSGGFSTQVIGEVVAFAGNFAPGDYLPCDGRSLAISQYETLYAVIGNRYGGSVAEGTFKLPDLQGRAIMGASSDAALGTVVGQDSVTITTANLPSSMGGFQAPLDNREPSLELNYIVATQGIFPSADSGGLEASMPYMGEVMAFAGDIAHIPQGWALADGRELAINVNQPLFSLLGFTYGGNGSTTFRLPNLTNRVVIGVDHDANIQVGQNLGSDTITLTTSTTPDRAPTLSVPASTTSVIEQQGPVFITTNAATVGDLDLDWGAGQSYSGTSLTVARDSGADGRDSFDISTVGATFTITADNHLAYQGQTFGSFSDSGGTLTIHFDTGGTNPTKALVNDVLRHITYDNTSDSPPRLQVTFSDGNTGAQGADGAKTASVQVTPPIVAVNDAPVAGTSSVTFNEDTSFTFHASDFHFTDPADAPPGNGLLNVLLTSLPSVGTLTYNGVALTAANVAGNGFAVSVADLAAGKLTFTPAANGNGVGYANFSFRIQDNGGTANNGVDVSAAAATMSINVSAVNDAPVLANVGPGAAATEQVGALLDSNVTVSDIELDALNGGSGNYAGASVSIVRNGGASAQDSFGFDTASASFTVSGANLQAGGQTFATFSNSGGTLTVNFTGSGAAATTALVNNVLDHVRYTNTSDTPTPSVTLNYAFNDGNANGAFSGAQGSGGAGTAGGSITVSVTAVNDAPALSVGGTAAYTENAAPVTLDSGLVVSDVDGGVGYSATVQITGGFVAGDTLSGGGIWDAATHTFTTNLGAGASLAALQADLRTLAFSSTSDNPGALPRTLTWTISDGSSANATFTTTTLVNVTPVNDAPDVISHGNTARDTAATDAGSIVATGNALTGDSDREGDTLSVSAVNGAAGNVGHAAAGSYGTLNVAADGSYTYTANAAFDAVAAGQHATDQFTVTVSDGHGGTTDATLTFDITGANDTPVVVAGNTITYTERDAAVALDPALTLNDAEGVLAGATVKVSNGFQSGDTLHFTNQNGITGSYDAASGLLTLTGSASVANYQAALRSVTFDNQTSNGVSGSRTIDWQVGDRAASSVVAPVTVAVGANPSAMATGDFNGDGVLDLAVDNSRDGTVSVLLGNGAGGFGPAATFATGIGTSKTGEITAFDVNGDHKLDLVVADTAGTKIAVLLGDGSGHFAAPITSEVGFLPQGLAFGDLNGDGKADLVVAHLSTTGGVSVLLGDGNGHFVTAANYAGGPATVALGDLNGDGKLDLVTAHSDMSGGAGTGTVSVQLGDGNGGFGTATDYTPGTASDPTSVALGDVNGDGKLDMVFANQATNTVAVLLGNGACSFGVATNFVVGPAPAKVALGDLNGDGRLDLVTRNRDDTASVLLGDGAGGFAAATNFSAGPSLGAVALGDFNADGKSDLVLATTLDNHVTVLFDTAAVFGPAADFAAGSVPAGKIATGDFNGDGVLDLAISPLDGVADEIWVMLGNGSGGFGAPTQVLLAPGAAPFDIAVGDVNHDGKLDLVTANFFDNSVSVLMGDGRGHFALATTLSISSTSEDATFGQRPVTVALGDVNGDGSLDIVTGNATASLSVLLGDGAGGFAPATTIGLNGAPVSIEFADVNADGKLDIVAGEVAPAHGAVTLPKGSVEVLIGLGTGGFASAAYIRLGGDKLHTNGVAVGDLNGDGKLDIVVGYDNPATGHGAIVPVMDNLSVLLGNGNGGFAITTYTVSGNASSVTLGDLNGDGKLDLVVTDTDANTVTVLPGTGDGSFRQGIGVVAGSGPDFVVVGDFNSDGRADLAFANRGNNNVSILLGSNAGLSAVAHTTIDYQVPVVIGGTLSGTVVEAGGVDNASAGSPDTSGTLTTTPARSFTTAPAGTPSDHYGSYTLAADGTWTYTLDNTNPAVQALRTGQSLTDTFTVHTTEGTEKQISITISGANDAPVTTVPGAQTVAEDTALAFTGAAKISVSDVDAGGSDMTVTLAVLNGQLTLGATAGLTFFTNNAASITLTGTAASLNAALASLSYLGNRDFNGTDTLTVTTSDNAAGGALQDTRTVAITVNPVNDAPGFTLAGTTTASNEDAGAQTVANFATAISAGPTADETGGQTVSFIVTGNTNAGLFAVGPAIDANGNLTYTAAANASGSATITVHAKDSGGTANGGVDSSADRTFTITVNPVNDAPSFTVTTAASSNEDAGAQSVANFATAISAGPADEAAQAVNFVVAGNTNPALFAVGPSIDANGTLTYTAAANASGTATITVHAHDNGGTAGGGIDNAADQTFTITVSPVNDAPSFTLAGNTSSNEDAGAQTVAGFATAISAGPADESAQAVSFLVSGNSNPALFSVGPSIAADGTLTYTAAANATGTATITVRAMDDGGTARGGVDISAIQTFTITVNPVNDAPSFTLTGATSSNEDAGAQSVAGFATAISAGPADEAAQAVNFVVAGNTNPALFAVGPSIDANGTLTYTAAANVSGTATITVHAHDNGGTADGGIDNSADQTFTITVNPVNDAPSFTLAGNASSNEDAGAQTVAGFATAISAGPSDESTQAVSFIVTDNSNPALFSVGPSIDANGNLTYTAAANAVGTATIIVHAHDDGGSANGGLDTSADKTFTITVNPVNDAPSFTLTGATSSNEDAGAQSVANFATAISAGPADEAAQVVSFVVAGNTNPGLFAVGPAIDASGRLTYTAAANASGTATITVHAHDNGGTADGGIDTSADRTFTITVNPVNDAPVATVPAIAYTAIEQTPLDLKASGLAVGDIDGGTGVEIATLSVGEGILDVTAGTSGATVSGSGSASVTITGTIDQINALLGSDGASTVSYFNNLDAPSASTALTLTIHDQGNTGGGDLSNASAVNIDITPVNDAPALTVSASAAYTENAAPTILDPGLVVSDVDGGSGYSATVQITGGFIAGDQLIGGGTWDATTHTFTTSGHLAPNANLAALQADLQTLGFFSTSDDPGAGPRTLTWTISDGSATFTTTTVVAVTPVNDAAVISGATTGTAVEAGGVNNAAAGTPIVSGVLTDADLDNPANTFEASSANAHGSFTMTAGGTWTYALDNGNADVQALNAGQTLTDTFTVHTADGTAQQVTITIAGTNDTPVVTAGNTQDFNANVGQPVTLDAAIALHDVDSATMAGARVAIAGGFDAAGDSLGFVNQHGISGSYDAATGVLTLAGNASIADYQAALASVTFLSTTQQNGARSIQWTVDDGSAAFHQSLPGITTLNVQGIIVPPHLFTDNSVTTPSKGLLPAGNGASGSPASFASGFGAGFFGNGGDGAAGGFGNGSSYHVVHTDAVLITASDATVQINLALAALEAPLGGDVAFVVARQANGDPLPDWLKFDPSTGTFAGLPPDNAVASIEPDQSADSNIVTGALPTNPDLGIGPGPNAPAKAQTITVEVLARDSKGNVAVTTFTIDLRAHPSGKQGWNIQPFGPARHASLAPLSPELAAIESAVRDATPSVEPFAARGMPVRHGEAISVGGREAVPAGRAGLTEQLASIGWRSIDAQRSALLASLQQGRR